MSATREPPVVDLETAARFREVEAARSVYGSDVVDATIRACFVGDPVADAVAREFRDMPGGAGWRRLDRALATHPVVTDASTPQLRALLDPIFSPPDWVDFETIDAGAVATWRAGGLNQLLALAAGSLAFGYQSASLVRPLAATGRLSGGAARRLNETLRWMLAATTPAVGAMSPGGEGLAATVRLRLVHALVRLHLHGDESWDEAGWGVPISRADTLLTGLGGFFLVPLQALEDLGVRFSDDELEALFHQWRWITFVLGVPEEFLPMTLTEAQIQLESALAIDSGPNEDSARLMAALIHNGVDFDEVLPEPLARTFGGAHSRVTAAFVRRWMETDMADELGVPDNPLFRRADLAIRPLVRAREAARAGGLLGTDVTLARREHELIERLALVEGGGVITPDRVAEEPVLAAAR